GEVEARHAGGRQLEARPAAEDDQPGLVALVAAAAQGHGVVDELLDALPAAVHGLPLALHLLGGAVAAGDDKKDSDGLVAVRQADFGEGEDQEEEDRAAQADGQPAAHRAEAGEAAEAEEDDDRQQAEQQQPPRLPRFEAPGGAEGVAEEVAEWPDGPA